MSDVKRLVVLVNGPMDGCIVELKPHITQFQKAYTIGSYLKYDCTDKVDEFGLQVFEYIGLEQLESQCQD